MDYTLHELINASGLMQSYVDDGMTIHAAAGKIEDQVENGSLCLLPEVYVKSCYGVRDENIGQLLINLRA